MGQTAAQRSAAKKVANKRAVKKAAAQVKEARERASDLEVTSADDWAGKKEAGETKLQVPSGNVCLVRNPGMEAFVAKGLIPNGLMPIVMDAIEKGKGISPKQAKSMTQDPAMIASMFELADAVVCEVVVQPVVLPVPAAGEERTKGVLYIDEVLLEDKMFIFQFAVGGSRDLERFREQSNAAVADVADVASAPDETE